MKLVLTGGHLSPALAVIEQLPKNTDILLIGRKHALEGDDAISLEERSARALNIPFISITTGRIQRKFTKYTLFSLIKLPVGFFQAYTILKTFKPDVLVTFGGYITIPVGLAAFFLKIPIVIHEQTLEAGFANKLIASIAKKICISWESSISVFPKSKTVLTGNPLRKEFLSGSTDYLNFISQAFEDEKLPFVYVTGGSLGSHKVNSIIEEALPALLYTAKVVHQTGDAQQYKDFERLSKLVEKLPQALKNRYIPVRFVMPNKVFSIMQKADLVIARSGINTVSELLYLNKMAILIPLTVGQKDEQKKNAFFLKEKKLAEIVEQDTISSSHLLSVIDRMLKNKNKYTLGDPEKEKAVFQHAAKKIVEVIHSAYDQKNNP